MKKTFLFALFLFSFFLIPKDTFALSQPNHVCNYYDDGSSNCISGVQSNTNWSMPVWQSPAIIMYSSNPLTEYIRYTFPDNVCDGSEFTITFRSFGAYNNWLDYDVAINSAGKFSWCTSNRLSENARAITCHGRGGDGLLLEFYIKNYRRGEIFNFGIEQYVQTTCSISTSDIINGLNASTNNIINNNNSNTNKLLDQQNQNTQALIESQQRQTDATKEQTEMFKDSDVHEANDSANSFFNDFKDDDYGLSDIVKMPLSFINGLSSGQCSDLNIPAPFVEQNITLPCMTTIYETYFGDFLDLYQLITTGFIAYWICINILRIVSNFKNPDNAEVEVLDL